MARLDRAIHAVAAARRDQQIIQHPNQTKKDCKPLTGGCHYRWPQSKFLPTQSGGLFLQKKTCFLPAFASLNTIAA
jgi:hypothetical protein